MLFYSSTYASLDADNKLNIHVGKAVVTRIQNIKFGVYLIEYIIANKPMSLETTSVAAGLQSIA